MKMKLSLVFLGVFVFCLGFVGTVHGENSDEIKAKHHLHQKSHQNTHHRNEEKHHLRHFVRHHREFKAREANSSFCSTICDLELAAVAGWLNSTRELKLLYSLIPPSVKQIIFGSVNATFSNVSISNGSISFSNGSISINLNSFYDPAAEWPILIYFAKLIGYFLSQAHGLSELLKLFPGFANIWKIILHGLSGGSNSTEFLIDNLKDLFGFNGTFGGNLFNFTYWEHIFSPSGIIHAVEEGLETLAKF